MPSVAGIGYHITGVLLRASRNLLEKDAFLCCEVLEKHRHCDFVLDLLPRGAWRPAYLHVLGNMNHRAMLFVGILWPIREVAILFLAYLCGEEQAGVVESRSKANEVGARRTTVPLRSTLTVT